MVTPQRRHHVCTGSLKQDQMVRLSKGTGLRMDKIHFQVVKFIDGTVLNAVRSGQSRISVENIESVRRAFSHSPMKSIHTAARK